MVGSVEPTTYSSIPRVGQSSRLKQVRHNNTPQIDLRLNLELQTVQNTSNNSYNFHFQTAMTTVSVRLQVEKGQCIRTSMCFSINNESIMNSTLYLTKFIHTVPVVFNFHVILTFLSAFYLLLSTFDHH